MAFTMNKLSLLALALVLLAAAIPSKVDARGAPRFEPMDMEDEAFFDYFRHLTVDKSLSLSVATTAPSPPRTSQPHPAPSAPTTIHPTTAYPTPEQNIDPLGPCGDFPCTSKKVILCHRQPNENPQSLCIPQSAVDAHLEQHENDECGCCGSDEQNVPDYCEGQAVAENPIIDDQASAPASKTKISVGGTAAIAIVVAAAMVVLGLFAYRRAHPLAGEELLSSGSSAAMGSVAN